MIPSNDGAVFLQNKPEDRRFPGSRLNRVDGAEQRISQIHNGWNPLSINVMQHSFQGVSIAVDVGDDGDGGKQDRQFPLPISYARDSLETSIRKFSRLKPTCFQKFL